MTVSLRLTIQVPYFLELPNILDGTKPDLAGADLGCVGDPESWSTATGALQIDLTFLRGFRLASLVTAAVLAALRRSNRAADASQPEAVQKLTVSPRVSPYRLARVLRVLRLATRMSGVTVFVSALSKSVPQVRVHAC